MGLYDFIDVWYQCIQDKYSVLTIDIHLTDDIRIIVNNLILVYLPAIFF